MTRRILHAIRITAAHFRLRPVDRSGGKTMFSHKEGLYAHAILFYNVHEKRMRMTYLSDIRSPTVIVPNRPRAERCISTIISR